jgi:hypothetical protein
VCVYKVDVLCNVTSRMSPGYKEIHGGVYVRIDTPELRIVIDGKVEGAFSGTGNTLGGGDIPPLQPYVPTPRKVFRPVSENDKFQPFYGEFASTGGIQRHMYSWICNNPGTLFFSSLVTETLPASIPMKESKVGVVERPPFVQKTAKKPEEEDPKKVKRFIGRRDKLGGRREWELRRASVPTRDDGRFFFAWGNKFEDVQTYAIAPGIGLAVEIFPPVEAVDDADVLTRSGRVVKRARMFEGNPSSSLVRAGSRKVLSICARLPDGRFRVTALMTEEEILDECGGEKLIDAFNKIGV